MRLHRSIRWANAGGRTHQTLIPVAFEGSVLGGHRNGTTWINIQILVRRRELSMRRIRHREVLDPVRVRIRPDSRSCMGRHAMFAPSDDSYLDVRNFTSAAELGRFLLRLDQYDEL